MFVSKLIASVTMLTAVSVGVVVYAVPAGPGEKPKENPNGEVTLKPDDPRLKLNGVWKVTSLQEKGQEVPEEQIKDLSLEMRNGRVSIHGGENSYSFGYDTASFTLNTDAKPTEFDLTVLDGPSQGAILLGLYQLNGDTMLVGLRTPVSANQALPRPKGYATQSGTLIRLELKWTEPRGNPDELLRKHLLNSDLCVAGTITSVVEGPIERLGEVGYRVEVNLLDILGGVDPGNEKVTLDFTRREMAVEDRLPYLKKEAKVILFLKKWPQAGNKDWGLADPWFGVQSYNRAMAEKLKAFAK